MNDFFDNESGLFAPKLQRKDYVDVAIDRIDAIYEREMGELPMLPDLSSSDYQKVRKVILNRTKLSYVSGFWFGIALASRL